MTGPGRVSVIMVAFNAEATIAAALVSALDQSRPAHQIVVVDDGSTDRTGEIAAALAQAHPRIKLLRQANAGPMAARNLAVAESDGEFIAPLDADDLWSPGYLDAMAAALDQGPSPAGFAYAVHRVIDAKGRRLRDFTSYGMQGSTYFRHLLVNFVGNGSSAMFRRDALLEAGGYEPTARAWGGAEDYLLQLRVARRWPVAFVRLALVGYRRTGDSYSSDPSGVHRARLACIRQALAEGPELPLPILSWVAGEAARVHAISLASQGRWAAGSLRMAASLGADPLASVSEILQRLRNVVMRLAGARRPELSAPSFAELDPAQLSEPGFDPLTRRRLARIEAFDRARELELKAFAEARAQAAPEALAPR